MSDLYLVLRHRLEAVKQWAYIDTQVLKTARERLGLSYEGVARAIPVSSKTYERWEKAGRVDAGSLNRVAEVLLLEIERQNGGKMRAVVSEPGDRSGDDLGARLAGIERRQNELSQQIDEVLSRLPRGPGRAAEGSPG